MIVVGHDGVPRIAEPVFLMMSTVEFCTESPFTMYLDTGVQERQMENSEVLSERTDLCGLVGSQGWA